MKKKFNSVIHRKPTLKPRTYSLPKSYVKAYKSEGVVNHNEQMMLFHVTQFGGFKVKEISKRMRVRDEFLETWFKEGYDSGYREFKANSNYFQTFGNIVLEPLERKWGLMAVNDEEMIKNGFTNEEIEDSITFLNNLNDFYSSLRLKIDIPTSGISAEDRILLSRFHGIPFLRKRPKAGGRFFHPGSSYQNISEVLRQTMTIEGKETSEIDLNAAIIQFLDLALKRNELNSIEDILLSFNDHYEYFMSTLNSDNFLYQHEDKPIGRDQLKELIYTILCSPIEKQEHYTNGKLIRAGHNYTYSTLVSVFPDFFNSISMLSEKTGLPLYGALYKEESVFAQKVLEKGCLEERLPILPLHDSFITTTTNSARLKEIMDEVSEKLYGRTLSYKHKY